MNPLLKFLSSVKITVVCLFWLFVLTFWGTVAQVSQGLYAAQERFFFSFFFLVQGVVPVPGAQLVLWVLFVNLVAALIAHFIKLRGLRYVGLKISHAGLIIYFIAAFVIFHGTQESYVRLAEGEGTNVSAAYDRWELALWQEAGSPRHVSAYDVTGMRPGMSVSIDDVRVQAEQFHLNCSAVTTPQPGGVVLNASGITALVPRPVDKERDHNVAGGVFVINGHRVLLLGAESRPTQFGKYFISLRRQRHVLPFTVRLKQFKAEFHPGTQVAKSYESTVEIIRQKAARDVRIYMNNPLRDSGYTMYQASYDLDESGRMHSILAVVKNSGQVLPYIACFVVFFGLMMHFTVAALMRKRT